jgi:hypothetical protein
MSSPTVLIVPHGAPDNLLKPNLMPFHIAISGSAPISSYFLKRPLPSPPKNPHVAEDTAYLIHNKFVLRNVHNFHTPDQNEQSTDCTNTDNAQDASNANQESSASEPVQPIRYQAAFRGRVVVGQEFPLPEPYVGVVLHRDDTAKPTTAPAPAPKPGRRARKKEDAPARGGGDASTKRSTRLAGAQRANALKAKAAAKAKAKQLRVPTKLNPDGEEDELIDDDDDLPSAPAVLAALAVPEPKAEPKQEEDVKQEEEEEPHMEVEELPLAEEERVDTFEVTGMFKEFILWNADAPVDEGRDEYLRAIHEWVNIAAEVCVTIS